MTFSADWKKKFEEEEGLSLVHRDCDSAQSLHNFKAEDTCTEKSGR